MHCIVEDESGDVEGIRTVTAANGSAAADGSRLLAMEDPEAYLRALTAPLARVREGSPYPVARLSLEAVANAFVVLGLLFAARAEIEPLDDDTGAEHEGGPGNGSGSPAHEGSGTFWFWPPVDPQARQLWVTVSTLWEAAWALVDIPGR
jgi:hypothetical protein